MNNLIGQKFGRLTVIAKTDKRSGNGSICWLCRCDCGNEVVVPGYCLKRGNTESCGCLNKEKVKQANTTHGKRKTRTYDIWVSMKARCLNPNNKDYGGRGIMVCDRWSGENGFINFLEDMGECPKGLSIERTKNYLGYFKENCIWATKKKQQRNTRKNRLIEFNGKTQCLAAWAEELGIGRQTLFERLNRGWSIQKAFTTTVRKKRKNNAN